MPVSVQLAVHGSPVGQRPALGQFGGERWEQGRLQLLVAHALGQWPAEPGTVGPDHVLIDSGAPTRGAAGDIAHTEPRSRRTSLIFLIGSLF